MDVKPLPDSPPCFENVREAIVKAFVMADCNEDAEASLRSFLMECCTVVTSLEYWREFPPPPDDRYLGLCKDEVALYEKALSCGMAVDFFAIPVENRPGLENEERSYKVFLSDKERH